jgi:hypothetical protein
MLWPWWPPVSLSLVFGGLPLIAYPVLLIVSIMSLSASVPGGEPLLLTLASRGFLLGALVYPVVYLSCLVTTVVTKTAVASAPMVAALPLLYLVGLVALLGLWAMAERSWVAS